MSKSTWQASFLCNNLINVAFIKIQFPCDYSIVITRLKAPGNDHIADPSKHINEY